MKNVDISIIIPVYNVEKYLDTCLQSILNQTFQNYEIICIDDGSTDNSYRILQEYSQKDKRFVIKQQFHKGAGAARNLGIREACGKYIQFLDSDDYFEPNLLKELYTRAEKYNADLVVCSFRKVDDKGNITESGNPNNPINLIKTPLEKPFNRNDFPQDIFSLFTPMPWNKLYLRKLITDNKLEFPELKLYEDITFVHSAVILAKKIVAFSKELINYRYNRVGSLAELRPNSASEMVKACILLKEFLVDKNLYNTYKIAFVTAFTNHIRSEISMCNNEEYQKFLSEFKKLMPNEWEVFQPALKQQDITTNFLNEIIGTQKVALWGASLFIQNLLSNTKEKNPNIIGIIDRNKSIQGKKICGYTVYPPEMLNTLKPDGVIMTVWSNNETIYSSLEKEFKQSYPNIKLLPNIFNNSNSHQIEVKAK